MELNQSQNPPPKILFRKIINIAIFCVIAALMNLLLSAFVMNFLRFPLFLDTVCTAAIAFTFGAIPGIVTAVLTWFLPCVYHGSFSFYVLCSIAEVLFICAIKPSAVHISDFSQGEWMAASKEKIAASYTALVSKLFLLYILCAIAISVLGGVVDYITHTFMERHYFSIDDTFKPGLIMYNLPALAVNIVSRIPVNIVDRFIVIFGGYFISRALMRIKIE
ncbi:MAG: hypothetical protein LBH16_10660 [Treponema sp.]|jgi:hypothetical protein|nr:hypothetical protein [Treponema sp.]